MGDQVSGAGGQCLTEGTAGMAVWAEVLVLGASTCAGDLAATAQRCVLTMASCLAVLGWKR